MSQSDVEVARRALACLDLTDLTDNCTPAAIDALCARATGPHGRVAAICIYPRFVKQAAPRLAGSGVKIATVVNFPGGAEPLDAVLAETRQALADGADEVDLVMPYRVLMGGDKQSPRAMIAAVAELTKAGGSLKVIIETGALAEPSLIEEASALAIEAGADFIKTSTGKIAISATPQAAEIMIGVIKASDRPVGFKAAGGVRTIADARVYFDIADRLMGPAWAKPETFRFGASGLLDALLATIEGRAASVKAGY